ncbi:MAG: GntR family transcriptional regulator, partial [Actinomycetota bacterium]
MALASMGENEAVAEDAPLYEKVRHRLTTLVLERSLSDASPLPTEPRLMEMFGVSRGTLRRAIDEMVRDGLLSAEQGRGTFVNQEERVRRVVWERLRDAARPDSRFDLDLHAFVPDFNGGEDAAKRVITLPEWKSAGTIF